MGKLWNFTNLCGECLITNGAFVRPLFRVAAIVDLERRLTCKRLETNFACCIAANTCKRWNCRRIIINYAENGMLRVRQKEMNWDRGRRESFMKFVHRTKYETIFVFRFHFVARHVHCTAHGLECVCVCASEAVAGAPTTIPALICFNFYFNYSDEETKNRAFLSFELAQRVRLRLACVCFFRLVFARVCVGGGSVLPLHT